MEKQNKKPKKENPIREFISSVFNSNVPQSKLNQWEDTGKNSKNFVKKILSSNHSNSKSLVDNINKKSQINADLISLAFDKLNGINLNSKDNEYLKNLNKEDLGIIDSLVNEFNSVFELMGEYEKIEELIPEIGRVINMIVNNIRNIDPLNKLSIEHIYEFDSEDDDIIKKEITDFIEKTLIESGFENKSENWIKTTLKKGCKPIVVLSMKSILDNLKKCFDKTNSDFTQIMSLEDYKTTDGKLKNDKIKELLSDVTTLSEEDYNKIVEKKLDYEISEENYNNLNYSQKKYIDRLKNKELDNIITDEITEEAFSKENDVFNINLIKKNMDIKTFDKFNKKEFLKYIFKPTIDFINKKIKITDIQNSTLSCARISLNKDSTINKLDKNANFNGFKTDENKLKDLENLLNSNKNIEKDVIVLDLEPEKVIPIVVNKEHIAYLIIEQLNTFEENEGNSFPDIIKSVGFQNDKVALSLNSSSGFNNHFEKNALGNNKIYNYLENNEIFQKYTNQNDPAKHKFIEKIIEKTITRRFKLAGMDIFDEVFLKNSVGDIIKKNIVDNLNIRYTYIPESNMIYYNNDLDNNGMPISIMKGILMAAYMYISGMISNHSIKAQKGIIKEKYKIDIGLLKNPVLSIKNMENSLNTKMPGLYGVSNGIRGILNVALQKQRTISPRVDDKEIYESEEIPPPNVDIDDEWLTGLLDSIINKLSISPYLLNQINENDFAKSIAHRHIEYLTNILAYQGRFNRFNNKFLKLYFGYKLLLGEGISDTITNKFDIKKINSQYKAHNELLLNNLAENIEKINNVVENIVEQYTKDMADGEITNEIRRKFAIELHIKYGNSVLKDPEVIEMFNKIKEESKYIDNDLELTNKRKTTETDEISNISPDSGEDEDSGGF